MSENIKKSKLSCDVKCEKKEPARGPSCERKEIYQGSKDRTSFFVFLYEYRQKLKISCKKLLQVQICRNAGRKWRSMSDCEKQPYIMWAKRNREQARCMKNGDLAWPGYSNMI
uniref:HMG box domain-containing protein n=1 Tax=Glossina brevipalpis TaxID=37001 RepID=A0A1A9WKX0_9MUSC